MSVSQFYSVEEYPAGSPLLRDSPKKQNGEFLYASGIIAARVFVTATDETVAECGTAQQAAAVEFALNSHPPLLSALDVWRDYEMQAEAPPSEGPFNLKRHEDWQQIRTQMPDQAFHQNELGQWTARKNQELLNMRLNPGSSTAGNQDLGEGAPVANVQTPPASSPAVAVDPNTSEAPPEKPPADQGADVSTSDHSEDATGSDTQQI